MIREARIADGLVVTGHEGDQRDLPPTAAAMTARVQGRLAHKKQHPLQGHHTGVTRN